MIGDMYTDLERSIVIHLEAKLAGITPAVMVHMQQFVVPEISGEVNPTVIDISKLVDKYAPENGGGVKAVLVTKDKVAGTVIGMPWPEGFKVTYDFVTYADNLEGMRVAEATIREALAPRKPVYLYSTVDPLVPVLTKSYAEITYGLYINRDDSVQRRYQRHLQLTFEVFNYANAVTNMGVLIKEIQRTVDVITLADLVKP